MTNDKYKILLRIYSAAPLSPVYKDDFCKKKKTLLRNMKIIKELLDAKFIEQETGTRKLLITSTGIAELEKATERREDIRRLSLHFWLSALLSLAALAVSIIAAIK